MLSDKDIVFGYNEILLFYEEFLANQRNGFKPSTNKILKDYLKEKKIILAFKNIEEDFPKHKTTAKSFFNCKAYSNESQLHALFRHLRNAYAHGHVELVKIKHKQFYSFEDKYTSGSRKGQASMIGQIYHKDLSNFITVLKSNKK